MRVGSFSFSPGLGPTLVTLAVLPLLMTLGIWQLGRADEKREMLAMYQERAKSAPLRVDTGQWTVMHARGEPGDLAYFRVEMRGRFDGARQYLLDNRTRNGVAGYEVLTAFTPDGAGGGLMVNRGWVPLGKSRADLPALPVPNESLRVTGTIDMQRKPLPLLGESGYQRLGWPKVVQRIDLEEMAKGLGYPLLAVIVLLDEEAPAGFTREWKPYYGIPVSRHQGYAVQWFALAAALIAIYVIVNTRRIRDG